MFKSIGESVFTADGENCARSKHNNLVWMTNVVGFAPSDVDAEWCKRLASNKFEKIVWSHG